MGERGCHCIVWVSRGRGARTSSHHSSRGVDAHLPSQGEVGVPGCERTTRVSSISRRANGCRLYLSRERLHESVDALGLSGQAEAPKEDTQRGAGRTRLGLGLGLGLKEDTQGGAGRARLWREARG